MLYEFYLTWWIGETLIYDQAKPFGLIMHVSELMGFEQMCEENIEY